MIVAEELQSCLGRNVGRGYPTHRLGTRTRELHVPEIHFGLGELHTHVLLTIPRPMYRNDAGLHRLGGVIVHDNEGLPYKHNLFQLKQGTMAVHRLGMGLHGELVAGVRFSKHRQGYR